MKMYIARNKDNKLYLYPNRPEKEDYYGMWQGEEGQIPDSPLFSDIFWEDNNPVEVEVNITIENV